MQECVENIDNKFMKALGKIVKLHRKELKKSMYEISAESCMSKSTWREIELGICKDIKLKSLYKIAYGLNIPGSTLLKELEQNLGSDFTLSDFD